MRRLDIGIASYGNTEKLASTVDSIIKNSVTDWRLFITDNPQPDPGTRDLILSLTKGNSRIVPIFLDFNRGYAGAVNELIRRVTAETQVERSEYIAYCDNDIEIHTPGWDETLCKILDDNPECAQVFPGAGHYGFFNGKYHECLWSAGFCWVLRPNLSKEVNFLTLMDNTLGHHEEVDLAIKLRLNGSTIGCDPGVQVTHHATATSSPESAKRIHAGVVRWMNRWNRYFCGDILKYPNPDPDSGEGYDPRSLRYTDWHPDALFLERMTLHYFPDWNSNPRTVNVPGVGEMDVIEVLKPKGCYVGRAI